MDWFLGVLTPVQGAFAPHMTPLREAWLKHNFRSLGSYMHVMCSESLGTLASKWLLSTNFSTFSLSFPAMTS